MLKQDIINKKETDFITKSVSQIINLLSFLT